jgi:transcriptional regulator with XRE-family HTH domain
LSFHSRLINLRKQAGHSQKSLCEIMKSQGVKVSKHRYGRIERGLCGPSIKEIDALCTILDVTADFLVRGRDDIFASLSQEKRMLMNQYISKPRVLTEKEKGFTPPPPETRTNLSDN